VTVRVIGGSLVERSTVTSSFSMQPDAWMVTDTGKIGVFISPESGDSGDWSAYINGVAKRAYCAWPQTPEHFTELGVSVSNLWGVKGYQRMEWFID
jgi:hypothetical protein